MDFPGDIAEKISSYLEVQEKDCFFGCRNENKEKKQKRTDILECTAEFVQNWDCVYDETTLVGSYRYWAMLQDDVRDYINKWAGRGVNNGTWYGR